MFVLHRFTAECNLIIMWNPNLGTRHLVPCTWRWKEGGRKGKRKDGERERRRWRKIEDKSRSSRELEGEEDYPKGDEGGKDQRDRN